MTLATALLLATLVSDSLLDSPLIQHVPATEIRRCTFFKCQDEYRIESFRINKWEENVTGNPNARATVYVQRHRITPQANERVCGYNMEFDIFDNGSAVIYPTGSGYELRFLIPEILNRPGHIVGWVRVAYALDPKTPCPYPGYTDF